MTKHVLDPSRGDDFSKCQGGCINGPPDHCHCDYHDGVHGCRMGNKVLVDRLVATLGDQDENDWAPPLAVG